MLDNPDLIASLIGFDGLLAIAITGIATKLLTEDRGKRLEALKDTVYDRLTALEGGISYAKGRLDGLEKILADNRVTPAEVETMRTEARSIREEIGSIVNGGDVA